MNRERNKRGGSMDVVDLSLYFSPSPVSSLETIDQKGHISPSRVNELEMQSSATSTISAIDRGMQNPCTLSPLNLPEKGQMCSSYQPKALPNPADKRNDSCRADLPHQLDYADAIPKETKLQTVRSAGSLASLQARSALSAVSMMGSEVERRRSLDKEAAELARLIDPQYFDIGEPMVDMNAPLGSSLRHGDDKDDRNDSPRSDGIPVEPMTPKISLAKPITPSTFVHNGLAGRRISLDMPDLGLTSSESLTSPQCVEDQLVRSNELMETILSTPINNQILIKTYHWLDSMKAEEGPSRQQINARNHSTPSGMQHSNGHSCHPNNVYQGDRGGPLVFQPLQMVNPGAQRYHQPHQQMPVINGQQQMMGAPGYFQHFQQHPTYHQPPPQATISPQMMFFQPPPPPPVTRPQYDPAMSYFYDTMPPQQQQQPPRQNQAKPMPPQHQPIQHHGGVMQIHQPKQCANCGTSSTPSWRRCPEGKELLCNACGLYAKLHGRSRPFKLAEDGSVRVVRSSALYNSVMEAQHSQAAHIHATSMVRRPPILRPCDRCGAEDGTAWRGGRLSQCLCDECCMTMTAAPSGVRQDDHAFLGSLVGSGERT